MARETITPKSSKFSPNPYVTGEDAAALALKYAIPVSELVSGALSAAKRRKTLPTKFSRVTLSSPPVKDMTRPSFAPRYRTPQGSSLAERVGSQKFDDAFQTAQENNFEIQNEQMKRQQEYQNAGITNQQAMTNAQIANQEKYINFNVNFQDYMRDLMRRDAGLDLINMGLSTDPTQIVASKEARDQTDAATILRNPESFTDEQIEWARSMVLDVKRKGGKVKTKFSYGS